MQRLFNDGPLDQDTLVESMTKLENRKNAYLAERRTKSRLKINHPEEYEDLFLEELVKIWKEELNDGELA